MAAVPVPAGQSAAGGSGAKKTILPPPLPQGPGFTFGNLGDGSEVFYEDDVNDDSIPDIQKITKKNNTLPLWGNKQSMNLNSLILENIVNSPYYKQVLLEITAFNDVINEMYYNVLHLEPWERGTRKTTGMTGMCGGVRGVGAGGVVSTAFCLLYKLFTLRISRKQLVTIINYTDAPFVRGIAFIYIRYTQPPADLWAWFEPYMDDEEEVDPKAGGGDHITMGQVVKLMLTKLDWYSALFPRIPVPIQKEIDVKMRERNQRKLQERDAQADADEERRAVDAMMRGDEPSAPAATASREPVTDTNRSRRERSPGRFERRPRDDRSRSARSRERKRSPAASSSSVRRGGGDATGDAPLRRRRRAGSVPYKCKHHLRHHHCSKHKQKCPRKATRHRTKGAQESTERRNKD